MQYSNDTYQTFSYEEETTLRSAFFTNVYKWMTIGLILTGTIAYFVGNTAPEFAAKWYVPLVIFQLAFVFGISFFFEKLHFIASLFLFFLYSASVGVTISFIFLAYGMGTISMAFFTTAGSFAAMSIYGYYTKSDLSSWGKLLLMALIGIIIASIANFFIGSGILSLVIAYIGVIVFTALTAYETQYYKNITEHMTDVKQANKLSVFVALSLYLNFINMFLYILHILGNSDD